METSVLVHNETTKLTATALDRASTGFGVGAIIRLLSVWRTVTQGPVDLRADAWMLVISAAGHMFAAAVLHWGAGIVLREQEDTFPKIPRIGFAAPPKQ